MFEGLFLGFLVGVFIACILSLLFIDNERWDIFKKISYMIVIIGIIVGTYTGISIDNNTYRKNLESFEATKSIYNSSLIDENLSSLERAEIVKMANEANREVIESKVELDAWWNLGVSKSLKEKYNNVELIGVNKEVK